MTWSAIPRITVSDAGHRWASCLLIAWGICAAPCTAQDRQSIDDDVAMIEPVVMQSTYLIVKIDAKRIQTPDLRELFQTATPEATSVIEQYSRATDRAVEQLRSLAGGQPIYATIGFPIGSELYPIFGLFREQDPRRVGEVQTLLQEQLRCQVTHERGLVVISPQTEFPRAKYSARVPAAVPIAWQQVQHYPIQVLFVPPDYWRRTLRELPVEIPSQFGGGSSSLLTEGLQWAALGVDPRAVRTELIIESASHDAARELAAHLPVAVDALRTALLAQRIKLPPDLPSELPAALADALQPVVEGNRIRLRFDGLEKNTKTLQLLAMLSKSLEDRSRRMRNSNRFKQILLAMHNYHDVHGSFPPAEKSDRFRLPKSKELFSWRVHLLPFLDEQALYDQFHLDEPWDSPHNKQLIDRMPDVFRSHAVGVLPGKVKLGHTTFLTVAGPGTAFGVETAPRFQDFHDGTSSTAILIEVKPELSVPWTAPQDYNLVAENPLGGILVGDDGRWMTGFADGSVRVLRGDLPAETVRHLFEISDGHVLDYQAIR